MSAPDPENCHHTDGAGVFDMPQADKRRHWATTRSVMPFGDSGSRDSSICIVPIKSKARTAASGAPLMSCYRSQSANPPPRPPHHSHGSLLWPRIRNAPNSFFPPAQSGLCGPPTVPINAYARNASHHNQT
ncbi:hypothetical protein J3459_010079 [Metarhizium acridum]|uniref:uncharacterized protein n=1 Tax=Metarhizium acridum TaxID=92637 RepID=UPI001C6BD0DE|nr:hypothetical protein J3459_010079 [Metarhizium acridum]KAG8425078.1 hypothetical protein J3458_001818 [Metarhizium acridum]